MHDTKQAKPAQKEKKLTLKVRSLETLEKRAAPSTVCPDGTSGTRCCQTSIARFAGKLTAVAYF